MDKIGIVVGDTFYGFVKEPPLIGERAEESARRLQLQPPAEYKQGCPYCGAPGSHMCWPRGGGFA